MPRDTKKMIKWALVEFFNKIILQIKITQKLIIISLGAREIEGKEEEGEGNGMLYEIFKNFFCSLDSKDKSVGGRGTGGEVSAMTTPNPGH